LLACEPTKLFLCYSYSNQKAFHGQLLELNDLAGQHEVVAEEMLSQITKVLLNFCNELKTEKKKVLTLLYFYCNRYKVLAGTVICR